MILVDELAAREPLVFRDPTVRDTRGFSNVGQGCDGWAKTGRLGRFAGKIAAGRVSERRPGHPLSRPPRPVVQPVRVYASMGRAFAGPPSTSRPVTLEAALSQISTTEKKYKNNAETLGDDHGLVRWTDLSAIWSYLMRGDLTTACFLFLHFLFCDEATSCQRSRSIDHILSSARA